MTHEKLPPEAQRVVIALCADYDRRERALCKGDADAAVLANYACLNRTIDRAVAAVCEEGICRQIRADIGARRGARRTPLYYLGEGTFKRRKRAAEYHIAKALSLV